MTPHTPARVIVTRKLPEAVEERLREHFTVALNAEDTPFTRGPPDPRAAARPTACSAPSAIRSTAEVLAAGRPPARQIIANFGVGVNNIDLDAAKAAGRDRDQHPRRADRRHRRPRHRADARRHPPHVRDRRRCCAAANGTASRPPACSAWGCRARRSASSAWAASARRRRGAPSLGFGMNVDLLQPLRRRPVRLPSRGARRIEAVMAEADVVSLHIARRRRQPRADLGRAHRGDEADRLSRQHRARRRGRRARADRRAAPAPSPAPASTSSPRSPRCPPTLIALPNVTLLPHIGSATLETRTAMGMLAVDNLVAHFAGDALPSRVV